MFLYGHTYIGHCCGLNAISTFDRWWVLIFWGVIFSQFFYLFIDLLLVDFIIRPACLGAGRSREILSHVFEFFIFEHTHVFMLLVLNSWASILGHPTHAHTYPCIGTLLYFDDSFSVFLLLGIFNNF